MVLTELFSIFRTTGRTPKASKGIGGAFILFVLVFLSVIASSAQASDTYVSSYPKAVFEKWIRDVSAQRSGEDEVHRKTLLGQSYIRTYQTKMGLRKLEIHKTIDGDIYDVGEYLELGAPVDDYIPTTTQIITARIIWAALTRNEPYLRSVLASELIRVETPYLGSKESQTLEFVRNNPELHAGNFYLTLSDDAPVLAADLGSSYIRVRINTSIDLLLQGQVVLYQDYLRKSLKNESLGYEEEIEIHPVYNFSSTANQFSFKLPQINYYQNERSYVRRSSKELWMPSSREMLAIPEGRLASVVAHRWATLALDKDHRYRDVNIADNFTVQMTIEGKQVERLELKSERAIELLGNLFGKGLPAYYNTISAQRLENDEVHIKGMWLIIDPELAYEHIFRITDIFKLDTNSRYVWTESQIRAILAVRMDHVNQRKIQVKPTATAAPIFKINAN
jgi:hypothetical protein